MITVYFIHFSGFVEILMLFFSRFVVEAPARKTPAPALWHPSEQ